MYLDNFRSGNFRNLKIVLLLIVVLSSNLTTGVSIVMAEEHEPHVHGIANLNIALQDDELLIEFKSPGMNIVGFEHQAQNKKEEDVLEKAIATLKLNNSLFLFPEAAKCTVHDITIHSDQMEHDSHGETHDANGAIDDDHHGEEIAHEDSEHHHDDHGGEMTHSEFTGEYHFKCQNPEKLDELNVAMFEVFPGIEKIDVQLFTSTNKTAYSLNSKNTTLDFN
ncbi:MAG: DUF2796 domain-containing protein [Desulfotalea sp.]